jgi:hypothetical protein
MARRQPDPRITGGVGEPILGLGGWEGIRSEPSAPPRADSLRPLRIGLGRGASAAVGHGRGKEGLRWWWIFLAVDRNEGEERSPQCCMT